MGIPLKQYLLGGITFATVLMILLHFWIFGTPETGMLEFGALTIYLALVTFLGGQIWLIRLRAEAQAAKNGAAIAPLGEIRLEESALSSAEVYLSLGESLDTVCAVIDPRYPDAAPAWREAFRECLMKALRDRRPNPTDAPV